MALSVRWLRRRLAPLLDARGPRTRVVVARLMERSGLVPGSLQRLAGQFQREGDHARAMRCWRAVHRAAPLDSAVLVSYLSCALAAGDLDQVRGLYRQIRQEIRIPPSRMIWLGGELAVRGDWAGAAHVWSDWQSVVEDAVSACVRMPSMLSPLIGPDVATLAQRLCRADAGDTHDAVRVELARLCFTSGHAGTSARLYRQVRPGDALSWLDQVAMRYGVACSTGAEASQCDDAGLDALAARAGEQRHADALMSLAYVALVAGRTDRALAWARQAVECKYADSANAANVLDDTAAMLECLVALRSRSLDLPETVLDQVERPERPVPKRFVCGFGWTGSGAVYDAIRGHAGFAEFEGAGEDDVLNADSETEATFIQSRAGLGELWMRARWGDPVTWQTLWDVFRCHVVGMCPIGYSEYKGAAAAANHVHKYGARYTGIFRGFFDGFSALLDDPRRGGLHALLIRTTEALCGMLLRHTGADVVLFNNAVFGRNAVMLEIFAGHRAAIVYRDPLDVYADRLRSDKNHWRTSEQMAEFYDHGLNRYLDYKARAPARAAAALREVPFERFVNEDGFRRDVKAWLLEGVAPAADQVHFDPQASSRNIGIHHDALDAADRKQLAEIVHTCQKMDRQTDATWDTL